MANLSTQIVEEELLDDTSRLVPIQPDKVKSNKETEEDMSALFSKFDNETILNKLSEIKTKDSRAAIRRITKEIVNVITDDDLKNLGIFITLIDETDLFNLRAQIFGLPETNYDGGKFYLSVNFPKEYPFRAIDVKFLTKVWHPNISFKTGIVCDENIKGEWNASWVLSKFLVYIQSILCSPDHLNAQEAVIAEQYLNDPNIFNETAKFWAQTYAGAPGEKKVEMSQKVQELIQMGYSEDDALTFLSQNHWNFEKTVENLLTESPSGKEIKISQKIHDLIQMGFSENEAHTLAHNNWDFEKTVENILDEAYGEKNPEMLKKIQELIQMGFSEDKAVIFLTYNNWDLEKTIENLLSSQNEA